MLLFDLFLRQKILFQIITNWSEEKNNYVGLHASRNGAFIRTFIFQTTMDWIQCYTTIEDTTNVSMIKYSIWRSITYSAIHLPIPTKLLLNRLAIFLESAWTKST